MRNPDLPGRNCLRRTGAAMICYRDMTFCNRDDCAKRDGCDRYLSSQIKRDAAEIGLPVSVCAFDDCYELDGSSGYPKLLFRQNEN